MSLAAEDSKYGSHFGEPDNENLGKRLKVDFKKVAPEVDQQAAGRVIGERRD